jgi:hypothetical protein
MTLTGDKLGGREGENATQLMPHAEAHTVRVVDKRHQCISIHLYLEGKRVHDKQDFGLTFEGILF